MELQLDVRGLITRFRAQRDLYLSLTSVPDGPRPVTMPARAPAVISGRRTVVNAGPRVRAGLLSNAVQLPAQSHHRRVDKLRILLLSVSPCTESPLESIVRHPSSLRECVQDE